MEGSSPNASAKDRIIESYLRLLAEGDGKKVTVSAVVKAAGCNRDTFYYHFSSIDDAARCALGRLAPTSVPAIARALAEGEVPSLPAKMRAPMLLVAKIARAHPRIRRHLEETLKGLWTAEFGIDVGAMDATDEAVLDFMAAGTVGLICGRLVEAKDAAAFDRDFSTIARTFGKSALEYAKTRGLMPET